MIGITITPALPHVLIDNNLSIETYILKMILPNTHLETKIEEIDRINIFNTVSKIREAKTVSEFLLYLSSYAKTIESLEKELKK